ncbi:MAG: hypothetical protein R3250_00015 [Melioribacteraceae bacterium]|nr:hypothetical protein [Melioribacteraceae bacterium]
MALKEPYCDIACADTYLANSTTWSNATDPEKNNALFWGRTWLDSFFRCPNLDENNPSDEIQYANALAAEDYLQGTLLASDGSSSNFTVRSEEVSAQTGTHVDTEYMGGLSTNPQQDIESLLAEQCSKSSGKYYKVITNT